MGVGGLVEQWRQGSMAVRGLAHIGSAAESSRGRSAPARTVALAVSLAADGLLSRRAGTPRRRRAIEVAVNTVDAALWAHLARDAPVFVRTAVVATVVPSALETGFRLGAGTTAVPVVSPPVPWRPAWDPPLPRLLSLRWSRTFTGSGPWSECRAIWASGRPRPVVDRHLELLGALGAELAPPLIAMSLVRRLRGRRLGWGPVGWAAFGAVGGYALARSRDDAQRSTTLVWAERTASVIDEARVGARVHAALVHNIAEVDPKSMLQLAASSGSVRSQQALDHLRAQPVDTLRRFASQGTTLVNAVEQRPIEPAEDRVRWVRNAEVRQLRAAIEAIDDHWDEVGGGEDDDDVVHVLATRGPEVVVRYRRREIRLERPAPELAIRLEPTLPALAVGSVWSALSVLPALGGAPPGAVVPAVALQSAAMWRLVTRPALERRADTTTAALVGASTLLLDLACGQRQRVLVGPGGNALCPGTGATQPLVLLLATSWNDLGRLRTALALAAGGGWLFAFRRPGPRSMGAFAVETAFLLMPALATATTGADTRREARALDDHLDRQLAADVTEAARAEARRELATFIEQLEVVIDELPQHPGGLEPEQVDQIVEAYRAEVARVRQADPLAIVNW